MQKERLYIAECIRQIAEKYQLAEIDHKWRQRDMEYLARLIEERSGVLLSLSTVKRLLRNDHQIPQPATLNALVSVLGYSDWQQFKMSNSRSAGRSRPKYIMKLAIGASAIIGVAGLLIILSYSAGPDRSMVQINGDVTFMANKTVSRGVPNTVIFTYDLQHVSADSFFIQQSWNKLEKTPLDQEGGHFTSIYYYPGYHRAKLIANDSVLFKKPVHITTDGWLPLVRRNITDKVPVYINRRFEDHELLQVSSDDLTLSKIDQDQPFLLTWFNVRDFGNIHSDNFRVDTRLKVDSLRNDVCPFIRVMVRAEKDIFLIYLVEKGCENKAKVRAGEVEQNGRFNDLSALGVDVHDWQDLTLKVIDKHAVIMLGGRPVHEIDFQEDFGKVVGLSITFLGTGSVEYARVGEISPEVASGPFLSTTHDHP